MNQSDFMDPENILAPVSNETKRKRFARRLRSFRGEGDDGRKWNRHSFERDYRDLVTTIEDVEDHLSDVQGRISELEGDGNSPHFRDQLISEYGKQAFKELSEKSSAEGDKYTLKSIADGYRDWGNLQKLEKAWTTYQKELARIGMHKLFRLLVDINEAVSTGELTDSLDKHVEKRLDEKEELIQSDMRNRFMEERQQLREMFYDLQRRLDAGEPITPEKPEPVVESVDSGDSVNVEDDEAFSGPPWKISGLSLDKKRDILLEVEEYGGYETLQHLADDADVQQPALSKILSKIEEEYGEAPKVVQ